jgi:hypothetical protein
MGIVSRGGTVEPGGAIAVHLPPGLQLPLTTV